MAESTFKPIAVTQVGVTVPYKPGQFIVSTEAFTDGETTYDAGVYVDMPEGRARMTTQGPQGPKGDTGPEGPKGDTGAQGEKGEPGEIGATGETGPQGERGPEGKQGIQGIQGIQGGQGATGPEGPTGPQGVQGIQGDVGPEGPIGPEGPKGDTGEKGERGPAGVDGRSYEINGQADTEADLPAPSATYVGEAWFVGTQEPRNVYACVEYNGAIQWQNQGTLQGPKGDTGPQGPTGPQGDVGPQGKQGPEGKQGVQGDTGATGPQGPQGIQGPEGPQGIQGEQGIQGVKGDTGATGPQGEVGPQGETGPQGVGISTIESGEPTVGEEYTETPVTVTLTDGKTQSVTVKAKNGGGGSTLYYCTFKMGLAHADYGATTAQFSGIFPKEIKTFNDLLTLVPMSPSAGSNEYIIYPVVGISSGNSIFYGFYRYSSNVSKLYCVGESSYYYTTQAFIDYDERYGFTVIYSVPLAELGQ